MNKFPPTLFAGRRFAVVGLGRNGLPAARALLAMGAAVTVWDDKAEARAAAAGLDVREPDIVGLDALVLSPGIPHVLPAPHPIAAAALAAGVPILSDAELLFRAVRASGSRARFAGITGTNGKSTTTALLAHILAVAGIPVAAGGNLGTAALALPLLPDSGVYVLEMSSYMLERLDTLCFDTAAMLNLSPDHLDRHGDMAGYAAAKRHVFDRQRPGDLAVVGIDDVASRAMAQSLTGSLTGSLAGLLSDFPARVATVSERGPADVFPRGTVLTDAAGPLADMAEARALPGSHNAQNAAAAAAMALHLGATRAAVAEGIRSYPGLPHRQELVASWHGVRFVNDSKATNADSAARALVCYDRIIWIAGGMAKDGGIEPLAKYFPRVTEALLIGRDAPILAATLARDGIPHRTLGTLEAAVTEAWRLARADGGEIVVLLSPACASWDQFTGFDQRGDRFRTLAQALVQEALVQEA
ncbi:MAG: UDP-N-acetylmuramoyl-L-alanine--D-glutamate ligase, partial [Acetobacteraceae bacterium]|nr:UDP-N-acetylmuramoyl-L-alanine--D-glutamate ligase [Acetobacteraceae bacterium]